MRKEIVSTNKAADCTSRGCGKGDGHGGRQLFIQRGAVQLVGAVAGGSRIAGENTETGWLITLKIIAREGG